MSLNSIASTVLLVIGAIILTFFLSALSGVFVMLLWNWLIPDIFHLRAIDYWEAWGLAWLCSILFKGGSSSSSSSST